MRTVGVFVSAVVVLAGCGPVTELTIRERLSRDLCLGRPDGAFCHAEALYTCEAGVEVAVEGCAHGCASEPSPRCADAQLSRALEGFCQKKADGWWCNEDRLVTCKGGKVQEEVACPHGCEVQPPGVPDRCRAEAPADLGCPATPPKASRAPPTLACTWMDWGLEEDGFYLISQFGTDLDSSTVGGKTTCGHLQGHYDANGCVYDRTQRKCLAGDRRIPWVTGTVDYSRSEMLAEVAEHRDGDVPTGKYFYVAGAQRFGCGAVLRVTNPDNGRCVVVYAEDGGPGMAFERAGRGGRRILDSSPAVVRYLGARCCWSSDQRVLVEWGLPGDVPGKRCTPCESTPARVGTEARRTPWDPNHMMPSSCR